jgi:hypothetical protein
VTLKRPIEDVQINDQKKEKLVVIIPDRIFFKKVKLMKEMKIKGGNEIIDSPEYG